MKAKDALAGGHNSDPMADFPPFSADDLESLEETLDILGDDEVAKSIRRSRQQAAEGKRLRLRDHV